MDALNKTVQNATMFITTPFGDLIPTSQTTDDVNATDMPSTPPSKPDESHTIKLVLAPVGVIIVICVLVGLLYFILRKRRLDRLRHHLMPLYNFDPAEEGEDWEVELLEDGMDHRNVHRGYKSMDFPTTENTDLFRR